MRQRPLQTDAVINAAKGWLCAPLGASAQSLRAFVRNRADETLPLLDTEGQALVLAVMVANDEGWHTRCRQYPLAVQAEVVDRLLALRIRVWRSVPEARCLARPVAARARAIRQQADALERRIRQQPNAQDPRICRALQEKAAKLQLAASKNRQRGLALIAAEQERQACALLREAARARGEHNRLVAEVQHLWKKEAQVRTEAIAMRNRPKVLMERVTQAIAFAIVPEALKHLELPKRLRALRLASPLSSEWRDYARRCLRFPDAGTALTDAWERLQRAGTRTEDEDDSVLRRADAEAILETVETRLALHRAAGDPSLGYKAPEAIARALFPKADPVWISCEAAMMRLAEELRRVIDAPCIDAILHEKVVRLASYIKATGDTAQVARLQALQRKAAKAKRREYVRTTQGLTARTRAKRLRVSVRERILR